MKRGEAWLADMNPVRGSEQAGIRPVAILQNYVINHFPANCPFSLEEVLDEEFFPEKAE